MFNSEDNPSQEEQPDGRVPRSRALIERPQTALSTNVQTILA